MIAQVTSYQLSLNKHSKIHWHVPLALDEVFVRYPKP